MNIDSLITTRDKYLKQLNDKEAKTRLIHERGKQNATAHYEWLRRKVRQLDEEIKEHEGRSVEEVL